MAKQAQANNTNKVQPTEIRTRKTSQVSRCCGEPFTETELSDGTFVYRTCYIDDPKPTSRMSGLVYLD